MCGFRFKGGPFEIEHHECYVEDTYAKAHKDGVNAAADMAWKYADPYARWDRQMEVIKMMRKIKPSEGGD